MPEMMQLPPGWEAIYNEESKRYYFVDHINKITQWEDPRLTHEFIWGNPELAALRKLRNIFDDLSENCIREALLRHEFKFDETVTELNGKSAKRLTPETSKGDDSRNYALTPSSEQQFHRHSSSSKRSNSPNCVTVATSSFLTVKDKFPEVSDSTIKSLLANINNDAELACKTLSMMNTGRGPSKQPAIGQSNDGATADLQERTLSSKRSKSPHRVPVDEFSFLALKSKFPEVPDGILNDTLMNCNSDEEKACKELNLMGFSHGRNRQNAMNRVERMELSIEEKMKIKEVRAKEAIDQLALEFPSLERQQICEIFTEANGDLSESRGLLNKLEANYRLTSLRRISHGVTVPVSEQPGPSNYATHSLFYDAGVQEPKKITQDISVVINTLPKFDDKSICRIPLPWTGQTKNNGSEQKSEHKTLALGPDESNRRGPNKENIALKHALAKGPSKLGHSGPCANNLQIASFRKYLHA